MYIAYVVRSRNVFNSITFVTRYFSNKSQINNVFVYFERAKLIDSIRIALRSNDPSSLNPVLNDPALDSFIVANALSSAPSLESALSLTESLKSIPHFRHTQNTLFALAKVLAKFNQSKKLKALVNGINSGKFPDVPRVSFMESIRWYSVAGDLDSVLGVWEKWRGSERRPCVETYNILMHLYARNDKNAEAVKIFNGMIDEGVVPNCRTYTVMIEHLVISGKLDSAMEVFSMLPKMRIKRTLRQYSLLFEAFVGDEEFKLAKSLLSEMINDGILPGQAMLSALERMNKAGFVEETKEFIQGLLPDKRIENLICQIEDDHDDMENSDDDIDGNIVKLKPWLDPFALANAVRYWGHNEVSALEDAKIVWTCRLVCKMIRSFRSAETAYKFFCWVAHKPGFAHDVYTSSRMICKLAQSGYVDLVDEILFKIQSERIKLSFATVTVVIDSCGVHKKGYSALKVFRQVESLCGPILDNHMLILYKSLLRTLAKCKMNSHVLDLVDEMILDSILPDMQIFTELMHHFALEGDVKAVQKLSSMVKQSDMEPDAYMFQVLIRAFCKCNRSVLASRVFEDMLNSNLTLDIVTKQMLVKSLWKEGKLREAASVEERSEEKDGISLASRGRSYTVSSADLARVCNIYCQSFLKPDSQNN